MSQPGFLPAPETPSLTPVQPSAAPSTLAAGDYQYVVTALGGEGETVASPTPVAVAVAATGRVRVRWETVIGATGYRVYRKIGAGPFQRVAETTELTILDAGLVGAANIPPVTNTARGRTSGASVFADSRGPWFRCRLDLPDVNASEDSARRRRVIRVPTLLYGYYDTNGDPVLLNEEQRIEIDSPELGSEVWQVNGRPKPLRKRRRVLGYEVQVKRVEELEGKQVA